MGFIIGIDPDTQKSGVAVWVREKRQLMVAAPLTFFELFDILSLNKPKIELVRIEAGWLNAKSNFHGRPYQTKAAGERIAKNVGSNHEVGRKIVEMCQYLEIPHVTVKPLGKVNRPYFEAITKLKGKNQDVMDAVMLVWDYNNPTPFAV